MSFPVSGHGTVMMLPKLPRLSSLRRHIDQAWTTAYTFADLVGQSTVLRGCIELAHCASQHDWPVLVLGESGTGKELLAQAIHNASPRRDSPFIALNCASVSEELIGTELFGYTDGTFTGALKGGKIGKIQLAHTGTLFLDDVDGMPLKMQASLLRVLEEGRVVPLGAREPRRVDVRVIAASNADLEQAVQEKRFRHDLFYRLDVFPIALPPLRERTADIPVLAKYFLTRHAPEKELSKEVLHILCRYSWPGNVRELRNVLIAATARARGKVITPSDLPLSVISHPLSHIEVSSAHPHTLQETESEIILRTVQRTGSIPQAASQLGIHYSTLYRKLKKLQLHLPLRLQKDQD